MFALFKRKPAPIQFEALVVKPGDTVILQVPTFRSAEDAKRLMAGIEAVNTSQGVKFVVLQKSDFRVVTVLPATGPTQ